VFYCIFHLDEQNLSLSILLESAHECLLLVGSLEATMAKLAAGIDELEVNLLGTTAASVWHAWLAESEHTLANTNGGALEDDEVLLDDTVVWESTHGVDGLDSWISIAATRVLSTSSTNTEDLLVHLSTMMVAALTSARNTEGNVGWMPGTNASNLTKTLVSLARKLLDSPTVGSTLKSTTFGCTNNVNVVEFIEDVADWDLFFKKSASELELIGNGASVDLNFHDVGLLLAKVELLNLGVGNDTDDLAVLGHASELVGLSLLAFLSGGTCEVLLESVLLAGTEVLVEATDARGGHVAGEDGSELAKTTRSGNVSDNANDDHWRGLDDSDRLNNLLLVGLGTSTFDLANDVSHTGLVTQESGQVRSISLVLTWEAANASTVMGSALARKKAE
jgi:hypothetical protein